MKPSNRLLSVIGILCLLGLMVFGVRLGEEFEHQFFSEQMFELVKGVWHIAFYLLIVIVIFDLYRVKLIDGLRVKRRVASNLSLGVNADIELVLHNDNSRNVSGEITDSYPGNIEAFGLPASFTVSKNSRKSVKYTLRPTGRGDAEFGKAAIYIDSPLKLWKNKQYLGEPEIIKIYPNFVPIVKSAAIGLEHQLAQLGIHNIQRRGQGLDFRQLREFREGDSVKQVDWKATSRLQKLISKEYQDERDQDIIFMLDCGRNMRSKSGELSHFDHTLNAMLITSYIALKQGDAIGMFSFSGAQRIIKPGKGKTAVNTLLHGLYDLHSTTENSDFVSAAESFVKTFRKRSLVIILTNLKDEQADDLQEAVKLLKQHHVVMVASLRDPILDEIGSIDVHTLDDALLYSGTKVYLEERKKLIAKTLATGVILIDCKPQVLHTELVKEYIRVKRSGVL